MTFLYMASFPDQYKSHPTNHLPVWPTNANDCWDPVTFHVWPCCYQRCIELPWKNTEPSEEYDEEYEEREDSPTKQLCDVRKKDKEHNDDTHINAIKLLTDNSALSRCVLDSRANRHIINNET